MNFNEIAVLSICVMLISTKCITIDLRCDELFQRNCNIIDLCFINFNEIISLSIYVTLISRNHNVMRDVVSVCIVIDFNRKLN